MYIVHSNWKIERTNQRKKKKYKIEMNRMILMQMHINQSREIVQNDSFSDDLSPVRFFLLFLSFMKW